MKRRIALTGNPNVGKSTIFNALTNLHQHTGNWAGVTVSCTTGYFSVEDRGFSIVDLPGIYSFDVRSAEEALTRDFIRDEAYEYLLLVCDATCLERGLHLLQQATGLIEDRPEPEIPQVILCVNLCDEAAKKGILLNFSVLEKELGIPVGPCCARKKNGLDQLKKALAKPSPWDYGSHGTHEAFHGASPEVSCRACCKTSPEVSCEACPFFSSCSLEPEYRKYPEDFSPRDLASAAVTYSKKNYRTREERLDRILTGSVTGGLLMCLLLVGIFWLTITGANYPSSLLWNLFFHLEEKLAALCQTVGLPHWFMGASVYGVYRVVAWIVSVMLPPMAIFFPLFTLLEDLGYLPRIAYNMDGAFHKCKACGKQCLTMAMGLGCNAAGVVGCRIIDSPRERLIAILTNSLVPCNGRFPLLLTMISLFFMGNAGMSARLPASLLTALLLTGFILSGIFATLGASWVLSRTLLKGVPSSFILELPPYRPPQAGKVIIRSIFDRTLFVLGRAVAVAAPSGLLIWLLANITIGNTSLLLHISGFLDPAGRLMGLDGIILMAFLLGFPANEIVLPIILMAYLQTGYLVEMEDTKALFSLLAAHGWTIKTAVCMAIFSLFHWPCSTTCLTIKKETGSAKWTIIAFLLPTVVGIVLCILTSSVWSAFL